MTVGELVTAAPTSFRQLGMQLLDRIPGIQNDQGVLYLPCPLCNGRASLMLGAASGGDAVWCHYGCNDDADVERAMRFLAESLPYRCTEHENRASNHCPRCLRYAAAARDVYRRLQRADFGQLVTEDEGTVLSSLTRAAPVPDPTILLLPDGTYLLRKGWVHWFHGKGGSGKTPLSYMAAVAVVRAGGKVLIVDHEMGESGALDLLRDLAPDLTDQQLEEQVRYMFEQPLDKDSIKLKLLTELDGFVPDLVIVDAMTGSMVDGSQNDNADVNRWFRAVPQWLAVQFGAAVVVIDHSNREDGPMPSGSARKHGAPQFRLWVRLVRDFNPDHEDGCSLLEIRKERGRHARVGKVVAELRTVKDGSFVLRTPGAHAPATGTDIELDLPAWAILEQEHIDALAAAAPRPLNRTELTGNGGAGSKPKREALDRLVAKGRVVERRQPGSARGRLYWLAEHAPLELDD